jgi:hypothetical protein
MSAPAILENFLRLALLVAGLVLPGTVVLRALRLPWSLAAAFTASVVVLYGTVVVFAWTGAMISLGTLAAALGLFTVGLRLVPAKRPAGEISPSFAGFTRMGAWLPLYLGFWAVVVWRLGAEPLGGPDTGFRWSWLAEQMVKFGTLDFYPPRSGADFVRYFWAESIPPEIASLHAWAYACGGSRHAGWIAPVIGLQLLAIHELAWRLGNRWGGETVARRAVILVAACPLLTWSATLGQETGLTALTIAGLVWSLAHLRDPDGDRWSVLAGIFAAAAAGAREYGPIFPLATLGVAAWLGASRRQLLLFAAAALPLAIAWHSRVWLLTGNPVYSLSVGGLFPTNSVFTAWNDTLRAPAGEWLFQSTTWWSFGRYGLLWAFPAVLGAVVLVTLAVRGLREARSFLAFVALTALLWIVSVAYTAGGPFYSLRVLSPAYLLLAVVAAYGLAFLPAGKRSQQILAVGLALLLVESLAKTLVLPENPYRTPPGEWAQAVRRTPLEAAQWNDELLKIIKPLGDRRRVVSDYVGAPKLLATIGTDTVPIWSPEVAALFDSSLQPAEVARRWRATGLRYLILLKVGPSAGFVTSHARWRAPHFSVRTVGETNALIVLEATVAEKLTK